MIDSLKWRYRLAEARSLLEAERLLIISGSLADIADLDARRERVERYLADVPETLSDQMQTMIEELAHRARDNQRLLKAYIEGARAAADRLVKIAETEKNLGAYRPDGSRITAPKTGPVQRQRY